MVLTEIVRTYTPTAVNGIMTVTTYDMPIHWTIIVVNGSKIEVYKASQDNSLNLESAQTWITVIDRTNNSQCHVNKELPLVGNQYCQAIFCNKYDSITVKVAVDLDDQEYPHNRVLILQGRKFYVDSEYLSKWSKYFDRLFNGNFSEKNATEITIEEVDPTEFDELLMVIGRTRKEITGKNITYLWQLADRFDMPIVSAMCEDYLTTFPGTYSLPPWDMLNLASEMKSEKLEKHCSSLVEKMPLFK